MSENRTDYLLDVDELLANVEILNGLDIFNLTGENVEAFLKNLISTLEFTDDAGNTVTLNVPDVMFDILLHFYHSFNVMTYTSASDETAYRVVTEGREHDILTTLVSFVLDLAVANEAFVVDLLGGDEEAQAMYDTILEIIKGYDVTYVDMNWAALDSTFENPYLAYTTDWDEEAADKIYTVLESLLKEMLPGLLDEDAEDLKTIIDGILVDNVYTDEILVTVIELLANLVGDFADYLGVADALLGTNTAQWFAWCTYDEANDEWKCSKDWGVDEAATVAEKQEIFIAAIVEVLATADGLLNWLFFGDSITLFNTYTGDVQITLNGGNGYAEALVPLLEAILGVDASNKSLLYTPAECDNNTSKAIEGIVRALLKFVDKACANPVKTVFEILPNLFYFIESDGLVTVVNNLVAPAKDILKQLETFGVELDLENLVDGQMKQVMCLRGNNIVAMDIFDALTVDKLMKGKLKPEEEDQNCSMQTIISPDHRTHSQINDKEHHLKKHIQPIYPKTDIGPHRAGLHDFLYLFHPAPQSQHVKG